MQLAAPLENRRAEREQPSDPGDDHGHRMDVEAANLLDAQRNRLGRRAPGRPAAASFRRIA